MGFERSVTAAVCRRRSRRAVLGSLATVSLVIAACGGSGSTERYRSTAVAKEVAGLKEVSYYPAQDPWAAMWVSWHPGVIFSDMAKIAALGANTVRIFVQPAAFGYPTPQPVYVSRLKQVVTMAARHGLRVQLTLFDLWSDYRDTSGSQRWAAKLLAPFRDDSQIAAVELQNEIDPTNSQAMAWARTMLPAVRSDSGRPVTVSVGSWNSARTLAQLVAALGRVHPDFYDLHFGGTPPYMSAVFSAAKRIAGRTPLLIGEAGYSTDPSNTPWIGSGHSVAAQEQAQSRFLEDAEAAARRAGLPPAGVWNLNDFPPLPHLSAMEQHYGLYRLDGTPKPAAQVIREAFTGQTGG